MYNNSSDSALLEDLGDRLARERVDLNLTQAVMASEAGLSKRTVENIEAGKPSQLVNLIRILRVLRLEDRLLSLFPQQGPRPMDLLKSGGKQRQRASGKRTKRSSLDEWAWGEEA